MSMSRELGLHFRSLKFKAKSIKNRLQIESIKEHFKNEKP